MSMHQIITMFNQPEDAAAFDKYFDEVHNPMAIKMPGLVRKTVCRPGPDAEGNAPPYHLIVVLEFPDEETMVSAIGSKEAQASGADLPNFAGAGFASVRGPASVVVGA